MLINPKHWPILSRLLDEALEMPAEARERWLESLPAPDSAYKEELRTLLRHGIAAETRDFLDILPNLKDAVDDVRAAVNATPIDTSPPGENAQSSALRKLSICGP